MIEVEILEDEPISVILQETTKISYPEWWFGTRDEYNSLTDAEKKSKLLYFIEEGS